VSSHSSSVTNKNNFYESFRKGRPVWELLALSVVLLLFIALLYSPSLNGPFLFDDTNNIVRNNRIHLTELTITSLKKAVTSTSRPVPMLSFGLDYFLHGLSPQWFRISNLLIHFCTAMLLYFVLCDTLLFLPKEDVKKYYWLPAISALLWVVHPLHIQSVTYIVQRMNSLAGFFYLLTILCYIKARIAEDIRTQIILTCCSLIAMFLAIGSKPNAAVLPCTVFLYEWFFFQKISWKWLFNRLPILLVTLGMLFGMVYFFTHGHPLVTLHHWNTTNPFTCIQRLMTEFRVLILYLSLLVFPHPSRLNFDHDILLSTSMVTPLSTLFSFAGLCCLFLVGILSSRRHPLLGFAVFWFFLNSIIESTIIPLDLIFEHRTYIPSMMPVAGIVYAMLGFIRWKYVKVFLAVVLLSLWSVWTWQRNAVWQSGISLWQDCVRKTPGQPRPHESLADYLEENGQFIKARKHYLRALQLNPDDPNTHNNIANLYAKTGRYQEAVQHYEIALKIRPTYTQAKCNLSMVLARQGQIDQAILRYRQLLQTDPDNLLIHRGLGDMLTLHGDFTGALHEYDFILQLDPQNVEILYNRSVLLLRTGYLLQAEQGLKKVIQLNPNRAKAHNNLGIIFENRGNVEEAARSYRRALQIDPKLQDARNNLKRISNMLPTSKNVSGGFSGIK